MTDLTQLYKALADPSRLRLLRVLLGGRYSVNELVAIVDMGQSRVSRHLKLLVEAGLAQVQRQGTWAYYEALNGEAEAPVAAQLELLREHGAALAGAADDARRCREVLETRRQRSHDFHDAVAPHWSKLRGELFGNSRAHAALLEAVGEATRLADLGCGAGELLVELAGRAERVIGVDSSQAMLGEARTLLDQAGAELADRVDLRLGTLEHLPLADGECEVALLNMVLHHLADPHQALREVGRTLADDGRLVVCDLASHDAEWMREKYGDQWLGFSTEELGRFVERAGLVPERLEHYTDSPHGGIVLAVARKSKGASS